MKGLHLALVREYPRTILMKLTPEFFEELSNIKYVKLLCNIFECHKALISFPLQSIKFLKEDGSTIFTFNTYDSVITVTKDFDRDIISIEYQEDIVKDSVKLGYAHSFNKKYFIEDKYTEETLTYLKNYNAEQYSISCEIKYDNEQNTLLLGSKDSVINCG